MVILRQVQAVVLSVAITMSASAAQVPATPGSTANGSQGQGTVLPSATASSAPSPQEIYGATFIRSFDKLPARSFPRSLPLLAPDSQGPHRDERGLSRAQAHHAP